MSTPDLSKVRVLLGVSGGIAAYKAAELVRRLGDAGAEVRVVLTAGAAHFVTPLTFQALCGQPVRSGLWDEAADDSKDGGGRAASGTAAGSAMGHIELARWAEHILIAPATANILARLAHGLADDLLTTLCLASAAPLAVAPSMNQQMWAHAATQANMVTLRQRGVFFLGPDSGDQACGDIGTGRLLEPDDIVAGLIALRGPRPLAGKRLLVSAGPTYEDIDPVRFVGNRSSGRMGFAVARAAAEQGAEVTLIAGPVALDTPLGVMRVDVRSAEQMRSAVLQHATVNEIFISAAAVGDYRPQSIAPHKLKKTGQGLALALTENPDILAEVAALPEHPFLVGFAAETESVEEYARAKLLRKNLDMIAANCVGNGCGFEAEDNQLNVIWRDGSECLPRASKLVLAHQLLARVLERYQASGRP